VSGDRDKPLQGDQLGNDATRTHSGSVVPIPPPPTATAAYPAWIGDYRILGVLGLTFKEDVADIRNSKVPDILAELRAFGIEPLLHDPYAGADETRHEYGLNLSPLDELQDLDALILAVAHKQYLDLGADALARRVNPGGVLIDVKSALDPKMLPRGRVGYWCL
jgi:UDP-N-acetyl-D-galactosamine dehydrogenase